MREPAEHGDQRSKSDVIDGNTAPCTNNTTNIAVSSLRARHYNPLHVTTPEHLLAYTVGPSLEDQLCWTNVVVVGVCVCVCVCCCVRALVSLTTNLLWPHVRVLAFFSPTLLTSCVQRGCHVAYMQARVCVQASSVGAFHGDWWSTVAGLFGA